MNDASDAPLVTISEAETAVSSAHLQKIRLPLLMIVAGALAFVVSVAILILLQVAGVRTGIEAILPKLAL